MPYSAGELAWIELHSGLPRAYLHARFCAVFDRDDLSAENIKRLCDRKGWKVPGGGRFAKGSVPANKGKTMPFNARSAACRFRKGAVPHTTKWLGHERITHDGYVMVSVAETNPHTGFERRYVLKHRHLWEQANGPVPAGHCLKCLDGDRSNCDPANWMAIPRALIPRLAGRWSLAFDKAEPELRPLLLEAALLEHQARCAQQARAGRKVAA